MIPTKYLIKHGKEKVQSLCVLCGKTHINKMTIDDDLGALPQMITIHQMTHKDNQILRAWLHDEIA